MIAVNLFHIFLLGPIMIYIGYYKKNNTDLAKKMLVGITAMIPFIVNIPNLKKLYINYHLINLFHWTFILAYFSYVSYLFIYEKNIHEGIYISLLIIGILIILIHLYKLIPKLFPKKNIQDKIQYTSSKL
jgi:hypothetical protein